MSTKNTPQPMKPYAVRLVREAIYTEYADLTVMANDEDHALRLAKIQLGDPNITYRISGLDWESEEDPTAIDIHIDKDADDYPRELPTPRA